MFNRITLGAYNDSADIVLNGVNHLFSSYTRFKELTGYNFQDTSGIFYEPERNIFVVERIGGTVISGEDLPEIIWCKDNVDNIIAAAHTDGYGQLPPGPTLRQLRDGKLYESDWMITRHKEQLEAGIPTSLSNTQYNKLLTYRQQLRDITLTYSSVDDVVWPLLDL
jgi:hypothetical protein